MRFEEVQALAARGIHFAPGSQPHYYEDGWRSNIALALDAKPKIVGHAMGLDAQPGLITTPNAAIPAFLANLIDPQAVRVLVSPMKIDELIGSTKKGDWTTLTTQFPVVESTGEVSSYGDWNNNGSSGANINWVPRQSYHFQTISQYGEREMAMYGLAQLDYKAEIDVAAALVINKYHNKMGFFGVQGLQNYGLLNDPGLAAAITPTTKVAGGTTWVNATATEIYADFTKEFTQLVTQMAGLVDADASVTVGLSPGRAMYLQKTNEFGINVRDLITKNFPNLTIKTAPEYSTTGGEVMQMILDSYEGVDTAYAAFTEKMRAHPVIPDLSAFKQKKSAGGWGAILRRPVAIVSMLGI